MKPCTVWATPLLQSASFSRTALSERPKLAKTRFSISASVTPASQLLTKLQKPCMSWPICLLLSYTRIPLLLAWMKRKRRLQTILIVALAPITLPRTSTSPRVLPPAFLVASRQLLSIQVTRSSLSRLISPSIVSGSRLTAVLA